MNSNPHQTIHRIALSLLAAQLSLICFTPHARAQVAPAAGTSKPTPAQLAKYDKNKNGLLDGDELAALQADEAKGKSLPSELAAAVRGDGVVELSPFEVKGEEDRGYLASNTLSGTRLNSKLEDLAASISVVTKQQLLDTASVDLNDIFLYETNTEGTGQFSDPTNDARGVYDNVAGNPQTANRIRGLTAANVARNGFSGTSAIPIDTYNVDSVEISRGPNSNIFGMGDASGTVNLNLSKGNLSRSISNIQVRGDSFGGFRGSIDLNRPILKDKFALRFSEMYEEKGYERKPSIDRTDRWQIAFTARPFRNTTINGSYESYHNFNSRANSQPPRDTIAYWRTHGSPTWDPVTQQARVNGVLSAPITSDTLLPAGLTSPGSNNARIMQWVDHGVVELAMTGQGKASTFQIPGSGVNTSTSQRYVFSGTSIQRGGGGILGVATPLFNMPETTDKSIYDWTSINTAAPNYNRMRSDNFNLSLEQLFINTPRHVLAMQLGWYREDTFEYRRSFVAQQDGIPAILQIDTNERLLDGRPNPYFLRPFIGGGEPQIFLKPVFNDNYRGQLAYQLDLRREAGWLKWLGQQRMSAYEEHREVIQSPNGLRYRDQVTANADFLGTNPTTISANNSVHFYPRYFLGNTKGGGIEYANTGLVTPDAPLNNLWFFNPTTGQWNYNDVGTVSEQYLGVGMQKRQIYTGGVTLQSYLLKDQLVTTFGWRRDRAYTIDNRPVVADSTGLFSDLSNLRNFGVKKRWRAGDTKTGGAVLKPFRRVGWVNQRAQDGAEVERWLAQLFAGMNVNYNQSQSFQPTDTAYNVFGDILPDPSGRTKDYGVTLNLFDDKLTARITHYDTLQIHARGTTGTIAGRTIGLDIPSNLTATTGNSLYFVAQQWFIQQHPEWTLPQVQTAAMEYTGLTPKIVALIGSGVSDVNDARSKGWELELNYNPTRYWTVKATGARQVSIDSNISLFLQQYIDQRMPIWTTIKDPNTGLLWWTNSAYGTPVNTYTANVFAPLKLAQATQGKRKPQTREYSLNLTTKYQLAAITDNRWLKNVEVGGSVRWASNAAIGYFGSAADPDGVVRTLDGSKPIYDKATTNVDLLVTYRFRMFSNRIGSRVQLNVRNVNESGHLQPTATNPDGSIWAYRIVDPRQFILSMSFDL